jgi:hypothetical protein
MREIKEFTTLLQEEIKVGKLNKRLYVDAFTQSDV